MKKLLKNHKSIECSHNYMTFMKPGTKYCSFQSNEHWTEQDKPKQLQGMATSKSSYSKVYRNQRLAN